MISYKCIKINKERNCSLQEENLVGIEKIGGEAIKKNRKRLLIRKVRLVRGFNVDGKPLMQVLGLQPEILFWS